MYFSHILYCTRVARRNTRSTLAQHLRSDPLARLQRRANILEERERASFAYCWKLCFIINVSGTATEKSGTPSFLFFYPATTIVCAILYTRAL